MVPVLDDVENFFIKFKNKFCRIVLTIKSVSSIPKVINFMTLLALQSADKDPHSIDKLSNLAQSRCYLRNALPPYGKNSSHATDCH